MPRYPKPLGASTRRPGAGARLIPADAMLDAVPPLDGVWCQRVRDWWQAVWSSPVATMWEPHDRYVVERLAWLLEMIESGGAKGWVYGEARALEERLGLTATGRRRLQWEISPAAPSRDAQAPQTPDQKERRWLRAIDGCDTGRFDPGPL